MKKNNDIQQQIKAISVSYENMSEDDFWAEEDEASFKVIKNGR